MATPALIFMLLTWTGVISLAAFCYWKVMTTGRKK
jgi:hypothetical protein